MLAKDLILFNKKPTNKSFEFIINTNNTSTGSSTNVQFLLPLVATGVYNFSINWGDGTTNLITAYNQAEITHTYSAIGTYIIRITGKCKGFRFNGTGDRLKLLDIKNWGCFEVADGNVDNQFSGCANLNISAKDFIKFSGTETNLNYLFNNCSLMKLKRGFTFNASEIEFFRYTFRNCTSFNSRIYLNSSSCTSFVGFLYNASSFNSPFYVDSSNCTIMDFMFYTCTSFNQDISFLNVEKVTSMADMLTNTTSLSKENYSNFLISCASQNVQNNVVLNAVSKYNTAGQTARNYLTGTKNWTITDGGYEA